MLPYIGERFGNPSSAHAYGTQCKAGVDVARQRVATLIGCDPDEVTRRATHDCVFCVVH
jgi:cysteine desulfurase